MYRGSLRPVVMITSLLTAFWSIFSAIGFYRNIGPYNDNGAPSLAKISIIIGSLYMGIFLIGLLGLAAAASERLNVVRTFAYFSVLAALIVAGVSLFRVVIHFTMKDTILNACTNAATGQTFVYGGWWGPIYSSTLSSSDAQDFCKSYYDRDSWSLIVGFLILSALGIFFSLIAFGYLRQNLDPTSRANVIQRLNVPPRHYLPGPYDHDHDDPHFADPPDGKPPRYSGDGREDYKVSRDEESGYSGRTADLRY